MKDFYSFDELSIPLWIRVLYWCLYIIFFAYAVRNTLFSAPKNKRNVTVNSWFVVLYFTAYAVFYCVNTDYFRYRDWLYISFLGDWNKEQVYLLIIWFCRRLPFDYPFEVFRLIVWGGGVLLVFLTSKLYRSLLSPGLVVMFLFVIFSGGFCYARASLAMAIFFMGVGIYLWGKNFWVKISGIVIAICSYYFHHELIIGVALLPCILFPFEKKSSGFFSLILLTIMIVGITYINSNLELMESFFGNDELAEKVEEFNEKEQGIFRVSTFISYLHYFYPFYLITSSFYRQRYLPNAIVGIYRIAFVILLASVAFFVVSGSRSIYTYRVMYISMIPISIMIAYCYNQGKFKKSQIVALLLIALLASSVRLINAM